MRITCIVFTILTSTLLSVSCSSPALKSSESDNSADIPPIPFEEIESQKNTRNEKFLNENANKAVHDNEINLEPPKNIKPMKIAEESIEGYYIPTHDFFENAELSKYALIINEEDISKYSWILCQLDQEGKHKNIGGGFFNKIEGGIDLEEFNLPGNNNTPTIFANEAIARERFPVEFSKNELHIVKAFESDGISSISKIIDEFGELYFIRIADTSEDPLPTSQILGKFYPTDKKTGEKLTDSKLIIWSNGSWSFKTNESNLLSVKNLESSSTKEVSIKGTWSIKDNVISFKRTTKCILDSNETDISEDYPEESYNFVFDTENFILWLSLIQNSDNAPVGFNQYLSINETSVFLP